MRKTQFVNNEFYHVFNRGTDKREVFLDKEDLDRFFQGMEEFNHVDPVGSLYENSFQKDENGNLVYKKEKLVDFVVYSLSPNHYHFILEQLVDKGIEKFMHRLGVGYTMFFNKKYKRSGVLFQGKYKSVHIDSNEYLLHLSGYVNLNDRVHGISLGDSVSKSSWKEYLDYIEDYEDEDKRKVHNKDDFCKKDIILKQFGDIEDYKEYANDSLVISRKNKEMKGMLFD